MGSCLDPEFLEQVRLLSRPGHELIEPVTVQAAVGVRERPQGAPASCLAFHAKPQHLELFQAAQRGPAEQPAVELEPGRLLGSPGGAEFVVTDRQPEDGHEVEQRPAVLGDLRRQPLQGHPLSGIVVRAGHPAGQLHPASRAGQMIVEIDAELALP